MNATRYRRMLLTVVVVSLLSTASAVSSASDLPPHIVVFLSDDHTLTDSSVYGSTDLPTPQMQRLAESGMTFERAYVVSPSCAPSRAALLTGLMPARNGAEANHSRPHASIKKLPAYLHELGYEVVSFGKVGHYAQTQEYGFDIARHFKYHEDIAVDEAIRWLDGRENAQPLCLFVGTNWPHVPWPEETSFEPADVRIPPTHVTTPKTRQMRARYYEAVRTMDNELGRVLDAARQKLGKDILFIHTSDHGAQWPFGKWTLYDDGIRTPLIVSWPGHVAPGTRTDAMVSWVDLLPTIVEAAGGTPDLALDGRSILPVLKGKSTSHRSLIYAAHSGDGNFNVFPSRCVRDSRFKYIRNLHPEFAFGSHVTKVQNADNYWDSWVNKAQHTPAAAAKVLRYTRRPTEELYDLEADPHELTNLAADPAHQTTLQRLSADLDTWLTEQHDTQTVFGMPDLLPRPGPSPNIVTVFIDDMGWADLSCFGGTDVETTHIDQLAAEGLRLKQFYVNSPICSPSRTALTTGNFPARHRITSYLAHRELNEQRGMVQWLPAETPTLPRMMSDAGFATGHFGKWHMGGQRDVGEAPLITEYGFERSLTNFEGLGPRILPLCDAFDGRPPRRHDLGSAALGRGSVEWLDRSIITARFVDDAVTFIDDAAAAGRPFFVNVWPDDVHSPFFPPQALRNEESKRRLYLGVLKAMDQQLSVLFDRIRGDPVLRNNTLILLASDNGHEPGAGSGGPLRGAKGSLYEGGIRSPLIVWGPGLVDSAAAGSVNDTTVVSSVDLVASLIALSQLRTPDGYQCDGENLLPVLLGKTTAQRATPLFWRRPPDRPEILKERNPDLAMRDQKWKLTCSLDGSDVQLFDLDTDPAESRDVADTHPLIVKRMTAAVLKWNSELPVDGVGLQ